MLKISVGILGLVGLFSVGNAATMTASQYEELAYKWTGYDICGAEGKMDPVLAAYGKKRTTYTMHGQDSNLNESLMSDYKRVAAVKLRPAPIEMCNRLAVEAAGLRDEYDRNSRDSQNSSGYQYRPPTNTSCITNYGYTTCTTN